MKFAHSRYSLKVNALSLVEEHSNAQVSQTYYLTQSFRFPVRGHVRYSLS